MRKFYAPFIVVGLIMFCAISGFAQGLVKGKVIDAITKETLPGASISIKGTQKSTSTTLNGNFSIKVETADAELVISYVGYLQKTVSVANVSGTKDIGNVTLESSAALSEVVVTANNTAIDRKTPVALSTVGSVMIEEKVGQQEFPELLKSTPGIYASKGSGGGYGDSRINIRGFQSANIAVMINGIPVNDPESGRVFWSNWAGLTDVTRSMQVQRGLGASKVAVPSLGGTINILTRGTEANQGGFIQHSMGNNNFNKTSFLYSTGLGENGWAFSAMGSKTTGDGWFEGLSFEAYSYFFNVSKLINKEHTVSLTGFGAPQYHGSRFERFGIQYYKDAPQGIRFNPNWGVLNGKDKTISGNFYHKPQASLNHYWTINENSSLSTALYASIGRGGNEFPNNANLFLGTRVGDRYSPVDLDALVDQNVASPDGRAVAYLQSNRNNHVWYGLLSTYTKKLNDKIDLLAGLDLRNYKGIKYNSVRNLLGAQYVLDATANVNNPNNMARNGDKIGFHNDVIVLWQGGFLQGEFTEGPLSTFVSLAASNTSYKRKDYFRYQNTDPLRESDFVNFFGFQTKGGANYNLTANHNVFANIGYFEKAPFFSAVFVSNQNVPNKDAENEKILSYELGYGYRSRSFSANLNLYRTAWNDRSTTRTAVGQDGNYYTVNFLGVDALHQGLELDFKYNPFRKLSFNGMLSIGDWTWNSNLDKVEVFDANNNFVASEGPIYTKGIKVGDQPQTTAALGFDFTVAEGVKLGADYNYYADFSSSFIPTDVIKPGLKPWKVPNYSLLDLNAVIRFKMAGLNSSLILNVNNVLNTEYISDANAIFDRNTGVSDAVNSNVYFGAGRQYTTSLKVNF
ncbi:TonB-dependent receptor [Desertivirga brevis]|uniref:TonB-dependent receptor n=1 Tax=Desertivirga brevis TaxID=2810310 RepID=UPI001A95C9E6|nr:TonB-dependent receptor [Pedobacter sp. SYSU D00873]